MPRFHAPASADRAATHEAPHASFSKNAESRSNASPRCNFYADAILSRECRILAFLSIFTYFTDIGYRYLIRLAKDDY